MASSYQHILFWTKVWIDKPCLLVKNSKSNACTSSVNTNAHKQAEVWMSNQLGKFLNISKYIIKVCWKALAVQYSASY